MQPSREAVGLQSQQSVTEVFTDQLYRHNDLLVQQGNDVVVITAKAGFLLGQKAWY